MSRVGKGGKDTIAGFDVESFIVLAYMWPAHVFSTHKDPVRA